MLPAVFVSSLPDILSNKKIQMYHILSSVSPTNYIHVQRSLGITPHRRPPLDPFGKMKVGVVTFSGLLAVPLSVCLLEWQVRRRPFSTIHRSCLSLGMVWASTTAQPLQRFATAFLPLVKICSPSTLEGCFPRFLSVAFARAACYLRAPSVPF